MKRVYSLVLAIVLLLSMTPTVWALAEPGPSQTQPVPSSTPANTSSTDSGTLQDRLKQRETTQNTTLTPAEKLTLQSKCVAAQALLKPVATRLQTVQTNRTQAYAAITDSLTQLSIKLKNSKLSTTNLTANIEALQGKIMAFTTSLAAYQQDINDLVAIDCKADPNGFSATLTAAQSDVQALDQNSLAISDYVNQTIKPSLSQLRGQLPASGDNS